MRSAAGLYNSSLPQTAEKSHFYREMKIFIFKNGKIEKKLLIFLKKCVIIIWLDKKQAVTEDYSSGRRGMTRNLVGHESAARVQISDPPPEKST